MSSRWISRKPSTTVNGTPDYYANALLQYQQGDELTVREDGLAFGYAQVDETKRIITQVSYVESTDDSNLDSKLVLKIATGTKGHLEAIPAEELVPINAYIGKLKFAAHASRSSRPKATCWCRVLRSSTMVPFPRRRCTTASRPVSGTT